MPDWAAEALEKFAAAREIQVAGRRADGTYRTPVTIWGVVVDGDLYVRSVKGPDGGWYRGVVRSHEGVLVVGGRSFEVAYVSDSSRDAAVDRAYVAKYGNGSSVSRITSELSKSTTLRVDPR